ncbi:MAG: thioesterase family protein [bacterium]
MVDLGKLVKTDIYVRYYETDRMKVVHHSNYFRYFELGRCDFFSQKVIPYSILEEKYYVLSPLISAYCKFYRALKFEDILCLVTFVNRFDGIKVEFGYLGLYGRNSMQECSSLLTRYFSSRKRFDSLVCFGTTEHIFVDAQTFKPVRAKVYIEEKGDSLDRIIMDMRVGAAVAQLDQSM